MWKKERGSLEEREGEFGRKRGGVWKKERGSVEETEAE